MRKYINLKKSDKENYTNIRVIIPIDYNPHLPKISKILSIHYKSMIFKNPELKDTFPNSPMAALRQPPNLRRLLCKSNLKKITHEETHKRETHSNANGWKKCNKMCPVCPYTFNQCKFVKSQVTNYTHEIKENINCDT